MKAIIHFDGFDLEHDCGSDWDDLWKFLSQANECMRFRTCGYPKDDGGSCGGRAVFSYKVTGKGDTYTEMKCTKCGAVLEITKRKKDDWKYARRKNHLTGEPIGPSGNGWYKYQPDLAAQPPQEDF